MKQNLKISILILFVFLTLLYIQFGFNYKLYSPFDDRWVTCLDEMKEHTIYDQQANCYHPPFLFLTALILREFFNFNLAITITALLLNIISLLLIIKIIQKETNKLHLFLPIVLYSLLVFIHINEYFATILGTTLLLIGFYILFYSNLKYKEPLTGLFFILSILSKQVALIPVAVILAFYSIKHFNLKKLFLIALPMLLILIFLVVIYPDFLQYTFFVTLHILEKATVSNIIFNFAILFLLIALSISLYLFIKKRTIFPTIVLFSYLIYSYLDLSWGHYDIEYYKLLFIMPYFIIMLILWEKQTLLKKIIFAIILVLLICQNLNVLYLNHEFNNFQQEYNYVLNYIPNQDYILVDAKHFLRYADFNYNGYDELHQFAEYDEFAPDLERLGVVNLSEWTQKRAERYYAPILRNMLDNNYSMIVMHPPLKLSEAYVMMNELRVNYGINVLSDFCEVNVLFFKDKSPKSHYWVSLRFANFSHCDYLKEKAQIYYSEHFDSICEKSEIVANIHILNIFDSYNSRLNKECHSKGNLLLRYSNAEMVLNEDMELEPIYKKHLNDYLISLDSGCNSREDCLDAINTNMPIDNFFVICEKNLCKIK